MDGQPHNAWNAWTDDDVELMVTAALEGRTPEQIADALGRSANAVICKLESVALNRTRWSRAVAALRGVPTP